MEVKIHPIGNSRGIVIPKPLLAQVGLEERADLTVENGAIVLRPPAKPVRRGWEEAAAAVAAGGNDALLMGEFANSDDKDLSW